MHAGVSELGVNEIEDEVDRTGGGFIIMHIIAAAVVVLILGNSTSPCPMSGYFAPSWSGIIDKSGTFVGLEMTTASKV